MTTLKLPFKRWVAQVSTGVPRSKSTYLALMAENLESLKACPWREAAEVQVALADHDFTKASHFTDACDAFHMTGNYDSTAMTEIAYAGMAAYRFKIPTDATTRAVALSSVSLTVSRDKFLKGGLHVSAEITDRPTPSRDWATVRGAGATAASGILAQSSVPYLTASRDGSIAVEIDLSSVSDGNPSAWLWVYVSLEDYTDHWEMYNAKEQRLYAVEGSGMLVGDAAAATFSEDVTPDAPEDDSLPVVAGGVLPQIAGATGILYARNDAGIATHASPYGFPAPSTAAALHAAYADFLLGKADMLPPSAVKTRPGAGFCVRRDGTEWTIAASPLVVPLVIPRAARFLRLAWPSVEARWLGRVWIDYKGYLAAPDEAAIGAPGLYTADAASCGSWQLLGEFAPSDGLAEYQLSVAAATPATILVSAWLPPDRVAVADDGPQGLGSLTVSDGQTVDGLGTLLVPTIDIL